MPTLAGPFLVNFTDRAMTTYSIYLSVQISVSSGWPLPTGRWRSLSMSLFRSNQTFLFDFCCSDLLGEPWALWAIVCLFVCLLMVTCWNCILPVNMIKVTCAAQLLPYLFSSRALKGTCLQGGGKQRGARFIDGVSRIKAGSVSGLRELARQKSSTPLEPFFCLVIYVCSMITHR